MNQSHTKIIIGIGGSSGSLYAKLLLDLLSQHPDQPIVGVVMSDNALINWKLECGDGSPKIDYPNFTFYDKYDFFAPFASGSAGYTAMVVCPASMGIVGRVATGVSNDLMTRAADVILKERRTLIMVPRETPFSLIHLRNMTTITEAGGTMIPAIPSFYSQPKSIEEAALTVVDRIVDHLGLDNETFRWSE